MPKQHFVAISGRAGSGKDTVKQAIIDHFTERGLKCAPFSFAGPLKNACVLWFGWDRQRLDHDFAYKEGGLGQGGSDLDPYCVALQLTRRQIMQRLGTECLRQGMNENFWVILADEALKLGTLPDFDVGIISDARFLNELSWVWKIGGFSILVKRVEPGSSDTLTKHTQHASETQFETWGEFDAIVPNYIDPDLSVEQSKANFVDRLKPVLSRMEAQFGI